MATKRARRSRKRAEKRRRKRNRYYDRAMIALARIGEYGPPVWLSSNQIMRLMRQAFSAYRMQQMMEEYSKELLSRYYNLNCISRYTIHDSTLWEFNDGKFQQDVLSNPVSPRLLDCKILYASPTA